MMAEAARSLALIMPITDAILWSAII